MWRAAAREFANRLKTNLRGVFSESVQGWSTAWVAWQRQRCALRVITVTAAQLRQDRAGHGAMRESIRKRWPCVVSAAQEDDLALGFKDIEPQAPIHYLVIPKSRDGMTQLSKATEDNIPLLGHLMFVAGKIGRETPELQDGFRIVINDGQHGASCRVTLTPSLTPRRLPVRLPPARPHPRRQAARLAAGHRLNDPPVYTHRRASSLS